MIHRKFSTGVLVLALQAAASARELPSNLARDQLVPWCIVPFDAGKRGPAARAEMLAELGLKRCAYDWRAEHVAQFEEEILQYRKLGIEFFAFWGQHERAFALFEKHGLRPQIWQTLGSPAGASQAEKVAAAAKALAPLAGRAGKMGCKLGLYNHGGWGGEPANLVAVCVALRAMGHPHVGIVYNWHHGHGHIDDWPESLALMKPFLHCLNLNGMNDGAQPKILCLGQGEHDLEMLHAVVDSGYDGPIGILDHQGHLDTREVLLDNLAGLEWLKRELRKPGSGGDKPEPKAGKSPATGSRAAASPGEAFGKALGAGGLLVDGDARWRQPPITVECRARLADARGYNILAASDAKSSAAHWEIFSMNGSGEFTAYLPGATPDHVRSRRVITDNRWHALAMQYGPDRVRLWVDGEVVADQVIALKAERRVVPGGLGLGRLVEGTMGLRGGLDEVRIRSGLRDDLGNVPDTPFPDDAEGQLGYWNFDDLNAGAAPARRPLEPELHPHWQAHINRDRIFDFYARQALEFRNGPPAPLPAFPGLDGGPGHWGNQNDQVTWKDGRVRDMDCGTAVSGVFRGGGRTIARAVSVQLGEELCAVFNLDTLRFELAWKGPLVAWSDVRRGLMHGIPMGSRQMVPIASEPPPVKGARYAGLHRRGGAVVFEYLENGEPKCRGAVVRDGEVSEFVTGRIPEPDGATWPERIVTEGSLGEGGPYAIDTLTLPHDNPWKALMFPSGLDFLSPTRLAVCTLHGDVWLCDILEADLSRLSWRRFAAGLHQPLGLKVVDGVIHVRCRDQIVALIDSNGDDEADEYRCVSAAQKTSAGGHDYITGLQRDTRDRWYFASGNQGLCRLDGDRLEVLGTGLRNPNGLGISPDGSVVLTSVQEGNWTPASAICDLSEPGGHFGAGGPREGPRGYVAPMLYLPRGVDNCSGGQAFIDSEHWGPVAGNWVHFSMGFGAHFLVLREVVDGRSQAAAVALPGEFLSGAHRGRFSPYDGQLYVAGAQGWGIYGTRDGCLQRVRFTGGSYPYPVAFETRGNGVLLSFADAQPEERAEVKRWFAQQWNYRYGPGYGSEEYSVIDPARVGHDRLEIRSVQHLDGGRRLFLEIPQLRPVYQLHLHFDGPPRLELFSTVHNLGKPFTGFPGYQAIAKTWGAPADTARADITDPEVLMQACSACHHETNKAVGPPLGEIRARYAGNPGGIVQWAINPQNRNPQLPPMPSFAFLGPDKLRIIAEHILAPE